MTFSKLDNLCFMVILASAFLVLGLGWEWAIYAGLAASAPPCLTVFKTLANLIRVTVRG